MFLKHECFFCHTPKDGTFKYANICNSCYQSNFIEPDFDRIFGDVEYGDHILILGTAKVGKTNLMLWFFENTKLRVIWFHTITKADAKEHAEIILDEKEVLNGELEKAMNEFVYKKILIAPSHEFSRNKKQVADLFDYVCSVIFIHEDKIYSEYKFKDFKLMVDTPYMDETHPDCDYKRIDRMSNLMLLNDEMMDVVFGPRDTDMTDGHWSLLHKGRNHGIGIIGASQRNQDIPKMHCNLSMDVILFKMKMYDTKALKNAIEYVELVEMLPPYHFIHVNTLKGILEFYKPIPLMLWK